ncbi:MAG: glycosyltransferase family 4 protein [Rikenellaceae bacterium]
MKKILIVTEVFYPENGLVNDFVSELSNHGYEVEVLTQYPSYPMGVLFDGYENNGYSVEYWGKIKIHRFNVVEGYYDSITDKLKNYYKFVKEGSKIAREIGGDFDIVFAYQTGPLSIALPALAIKKKFNIPFIIWTFDIWPDAVYTYGFKKIYPVTTLVNKIIKRVYLNADRILVSSKRFAEPIAKYSSAPIDYIPNWSPDGENIKSYLTLNKEKFNFTFTGNISKYQNLTKVIKAWKLSGIDDIAILNIVGDGSVRLRVASLAEGMGLKGVIFHGKYPASHMLDILNQSDVLLLPLIGNKGISKTEPYKLQSYLKSGKPIFGVIRGAGREIIEEYNLGICANPNDINDIALKFREAIDFCKDENNLETVRISSKEVMENIYNKEKIMAKVVDIIENAGSYTID